MRDKILVKFNKRCAYCGFKITLKSMQIDHIEPKHLGGSNDEDNLNPACRRCNKWKATYSIEEFRGEIQKQPERLKRDSAGYRLALDFGIIEESKGSKGLVLFYFELVRGDSTLGGDFDY